MANQAKSADKTAKKQPARKGKAAGNYTPKKTPKEEKASIAAIVWADGTDAEIAADLADKAPDWENWTEREKRGAVSMMREYWHHPIGPALVVERDGAGTVRLKPGGNNATIQVLRQSKTFATNSQDFINERLCDLSTYHRKSDACGVNSQNMSASLAFVAGGSAQDTVQSALLTQMAATHDAAMRALSMIGNSDFVEHHTAFGNLSTKLLNAYARQAETLAKLQRGAEQTVRHVYVDARTQNAYAFPPTETKGPELPHEQYDCRSFVPPMLSQDPQGDGVSISGDERPEALQTARGQGDRRSEG